ncbi:phosphoglucan phosphatase LSF1, chloroplastic isoform X1 [Syzygium oleosum]|uniref:phosphoglucan phosphatase LSF1, chloroplastic isoform X1 n=1 Tax=Syzygium oleosum TaxID=219896 RepID=UPI0024BA3165|nr:phosphoglucan phosphatase LSF1, chloroplastic isoform X1 [Syzygium oleosum]
MASLQLAGCGALDRFSRAPLWGGARRRRGGGGGFGRRSKAGARGVACRALAMSSDPASLKMNLNEYMVTLEKPLGIRFALSADGKIFVHALKRGGNAEKSRIIMVGDTLKKSSDPSGGKLVEIKDFGDAEVMMKEKMGSFSLVLERPSSPFPIHQLQRLSELDILYNKGHLPVVTWNKALLSSNLRASEGSGNCGFVLFSSKFSSLDGRRLLSNQNGQTIPQVLQKNSSTPIMSPVVCIFSEDGSGDGDWAHGSFPLEEYIKALDRSEGELYYDHSLGMRYSKITEQIYVGSCIQTDADVDTLSSVVGVTAILNFQGGVESQNWGINPNAINESCQRRGVLMINYPIRDSDSFDMRKKLPFCVGLLLRLLKKNHRVYITCTTGLDRSPACVIAYLHWITDTSLHAAYNFVTGLHSCSPDRPAIAWATWDLIATVETSGHDGPATHAVTFVWNGHEGEDINLVGDFTGNWKEPVKATHKGGSRYEAEVRLSQGKYYYKYIVNGQWRHSTNSPAERDDRGNVNNVIVVGDTASIRPSVQQQKKDANIVKVIERPLTESERFMLAKAARCFAFSVCPIRLAPK